MNRDDYYIEDILEMDARERDRVASRWVKGSVFLQENNVNLFCDVQFYWKYDDTWCGDPEVAPKYSKDWRHCGRLLEALPYKFKRDPVAWYAEHANGYLYYDDPLTKESIVLAAAICWLRGIEPEEGE